ncbi:hypothetical protein ACI68E_001923 [Malassezia pachydermatis]
MPQKADIERVKNLATGDARRSVPLPDTASMLVKRLNDAMNYWDENPDVYHMASENKNIEQHHTVDHPSSAFSAMERYLISASRQILNMGKRSSSPADFQHIQSCMDASVNEQLDIELPYESVPKPERRVALTNAKSAPDDINTALDDGVLLLCYIEFSELGKEKISICSGFAVQGGDKLASTDTEASGPIILESVMQNYVKPKGSSADNESIVLAMTRLGHIYPVHTLLSYLPGQDLSLFQLSPNAYSFDLDSFQVTPLHDTSMRTLPVSPYPAVINTELSVSSFGGWVPDATAGSFSIKEGLTQHDVVRNRWAHAKLTGYRDPIGRQAETGTYDELAQLDFQLDWDSEETPESLREAAMRSTAVFPIPGSSGGPVVDIHSGCVVGVVRGQRSSELGDVRGDAVPAEKIFEFFALPGLGKRK